MGRKEIIKKVATKVAGLPKGEYDSFQGLIEAMKKGASCKPGHGPKDLKKAVRDEKAKRQEKKGGGCGR